jgi:protein TonB
MKPNLILSCLLAILVCGFAHAQTPPSDTLLVAAKAEVALPEFQGGDYSGFREWLSSEIIFPDDKKLKRFFKEPVSILFGIAGEDGKAGNVELISYPDEEFAQHVVTLIESSPEWSPASSGETTRFYLQIDSFTREIIFMPYIFSNIETTAVFRGGGQEEFSNWMKFNTIYPIEAIRAKAKGTVAFVFYVDILGRPQLSKVLLSPHESLSEEIDRLMKVSPPWTPAVMNGIPVPIPFSMSVRFETMGTLSF